MGYRLKGNHSFSHEIKGIVTEQIDNALDCLKESKNKDEGIHEARVCVKKIRALLRLVQDSLIDQRRNELQEEARVLGLRIYADKPRAFGLRGEGLWAS